MIQYTRQSGKSAKGACAGGKNSEKQMKQSPDKLMEQKTDKTTNKEGKLVEYLQLIVNLTVLAD